MRAGRCASESPGVSLAVMSEGDRGGALGAGGAQLAAQGAVLLAGTLDPKLNPLEPGLQVVKPIDRFFPELIGLTEFYGTVVVRVEREGHVWAMGVIGDDPEKLTIRRALNMNVDLEGLKTKMAKELEAILAKEASLQEQISHLDAVLSLASGNGDTMKKVPGEGFAQSLEDSDTEFSEASGS